MTEDEPMGTGGGIRNVAAPAGQRSRRPGRRPQRRRPVRARPGRADRGAPGRRRRGDPAPHRGRRPAGLRLRADRRARPGDRVPGEDAGPGDHADQRRLLRVPPLASSTPSPLTGRSPWSARRSPRWWPTARACSVTSTSPTGSTSGPRRRSCAGPATWCSGAAGITGPARPRR